MQEICKKIGFYPANILLPKEEDLEKWAVVACDQFTSQPEYWEQVDSFVGDAPSTYHVVLPEAYLQASDVEEKIEAINQTMDAYLKDTIFQNYPDALIYIERVQSDGKIRHGIIGMVDLECYDFTPGNDALIRATEGTVLSRIPPRVKVRQNAPLEFPHVMLLIDDPSRNIIEGLSQVEKKKLYETDLMQGGGKISGYLLSKEQNEKVLQGLVGICTSEEMKKKYGIDTKYPMLFAVGDGNHSLATAKQCYENEKKQFTQEKWENLKSRYALVEIVNTMDDALGFEPIHRTVFSTKPEELLQGLLEYFPGSFFAEKSMSQEELAHQYPEAQFITYVHAKQQGIVVIPKPTSQLAVGTLQQYLDEVASKQYLEVDYIHGEEVAYALGTKPYNISFLLPAMQKEDLFKTVMIDGVLPRKTFSMGHAQDKRYYMEGRKIK